MRACSDRVTGVHVDLYGSLAATGAGHGTMSAALKGLCGFVPETINIADSEAMIERNSVDGTLPLAGLSFLCVRCDVRPVARSRRCTARW